MHREGGGRGEVHAEGDRLKELMRKKRQYRNAEYRVRDMKTGEKEGWREVVKKEGRRVVSVGTRPSGKSGRMSEVDIY